MTLNYIRKLGFLFLSLWLLFILIFIITIDIPIYFSNEAEYIGTGNLLKNNIIPIICLVFLLFGHLSFVDFKHQIKGSTQLSFRITKIEKIDYEHLTFLTTYIIPLVCFNFENLRYKICFFIVFIAIAQIYIKTDLFYANPTLAILNFKIYKVTGNFRQIGIRENKIIISRDILSENDNVKYIKLDDRIYYGYKL